ncbi:hypothetical protein [uncultured Tateyamaria sp.]|uniref:hypothetical protein n=1 Tax=uncultured Tateyamaria sp. TaxID=455651 RepID=UPI00262D2EFC|nr:hypothetical protein [uncultured Tateyamaria sp.]
MNIPLRSVAAFGFIFSLAVSTSFGWASIPMDCASSDGTLYSVAWDLDEHLSAYLAHEEQRVVLAHCSGNEMINVQATELSERTGHAFGEIERIFASETVFTFDDVAAHLRDQNYTADVVSLRRDGCVCKET